MKVIANYHHTPCEFGVGQTVTRPAFTDCFGVNQERIEGLKIERIALVPATGPDMKPYYRILAANQTMTIEAAERFFERT